MPRRAANFQRNEQERKKKVEIYSSLEMVINTQSRLLEIQTRQKQQTLIEETP